MDALVSLASDNLLATGVVSVGLVYLAASHFRGSGAGVKVGDGPRSKEEGMRAARERQQAQLAASAEARVRKPSNGTVLPAAPPEGDDDVCTEPETGMPSRMRKALERKEREEAAAKRAPPAVQQEAPAPDPAPAAAQNGTRPNKESYTERLARIERGKGPSEHNPLHGYGGGSSHVVQRKGGKGG